jgi:chemotaxis protein CheZ
MTLAQDEIGKTILKSIVSALETKGSINIEDVGIIFENVAHSVGGDPRIANFMRSEVTKLANYISEAKQEVLSIVPDNSEDEFFGVAGEELNAVVKATEDATNDIMDATDEIIKHSKNISDAATKQAINDCTIKIYDSCNFQDITGQRINKVIKTLDYVEAKVAKLAKLFGNNTDEINELLEKDAESILRDTRADAHLMAGPQLPENANSQDDIDALFNS